MSIVDGRRMAREILDRAKARARALPRAPRVVALVTSETPATKSYLAIKEKRAAESGCAFAALRFPERASTAELVAAVRSADADAVIVQLPLAPGVDEKAVCDAIPLSKDADVLSITARERFERGESDALLPPVVGAVREICKQDSVEVKGKAAVVIGSGFLVGAPAATWLAQQGAEVIVVTAETSPEDMSVALGAADIVIAGAGAPHFIQPDMLKKGVILIDAGTSESGGTIAGDADPRCAEACSLFTPVPGGVGPLAVACLFENAVTLAENTMNS